MVGFAAFAIFVIVIVIIAKAAGRETKSTVKQNQTNPQVNRERKRETSNSSQQETSIFQRASSNTEENFDHGQKEKIKSKYMMGKTEEELIFDAKVLADVDLSRIYDVPEIAQNSELMNMIEEILVKGMDTSLSYERDFVGEGLDMLNGITRKN